MLSSTIMFRQSIMAATAIWTFAAASHALGHDAVLELQKGDHICLVGNALGERLQHFNYWESDLYAQFPKHELVVRNLCFSADEPQFRPRSKDFGSPDSHLQHSSASVILFFFGFNESFAGKAGVEAFAKNLTESVKHVQSQDYSGNGGPRVVLVSPIACEASPNSPLLDAAATNQNLEMYTSVIGEVADATNVGFADVFHASKVMLAKEGDQTINGVHLNEEGYKAFADILNHALFGTESKPVNETLRAQIADKNLHWHNRYRAVDGYYIYGGRSDLEFEPDKSLTNRVVPGARKKNSRPDGGVAQTKTSGPPQTETWSLIRTTRQPIHSLKSARTSVASKLAKKEA